MLSRTADDGMPRLFLAVAVSLALHAVIAVSVNRQPGGGDGLAAAPEAQPLVARLAAVASESVVPVTPAAPAETVPETRLAASPPPAANTGGETGSGEAGVYYFKSSELDRRPFPLQQIEVPVPESAAA